MVTHVKSRIFKPKAWIHSSSTNWAITEPTRYQDALLTPQWKRAMDEEFITLTQNQTWSLVPPSL